jgi:hypothetical protein
MAKDARQIALEVGDTVLCKLPADIVQGVIATVENPGKAIQTPNGVRPPTPGKVTILVELTLFFTEQQDIFITVFKLAHPSQASIPARTSS